MAERIKPKLENADKGFHYTVSDEQIEAYSKWTIEQKLDWIENTYKLIYALQTPEERERMIKARNS